MYARELIDVGRDVVALDLDRCGYRQVNLIIG